MYVCGNSSSTWVLSIDPAFSCGTAELTIYFEDHKEHEIAKQSHRIEVRPLTPDEALLCCDGVEGRIVRKGKTNDDKGEREKDIVWISGLRWFAGREQLFSRFYDDELNRVLEHHGYKVNMLERIEKALPSGPHLESRFQNKYYGIDATSYTLSLILNDLPESDRALWEKLRVEPFGAVWESQDEFEPDFLTVTIVARDGDAVVFYNWSGRGEDFRLGTVTSARDENGDYVVRNRQLDNSELSTLQLALDRVWNPNGA